MCHLIKLMGKAGRKAGQARELTLTASHRVKWICGAPGHQTKALRVSSQIYLGGTFANLSNCL
jgi:hypothetical protein